MSPRRILQFVLAITLALASAGISTFCSLAKSVDIGSWQHHFSAAMTIILAFASLMVLVVAIFGKSGATGGPRKFLHDVQNQPMVANITVALAVTSVLLAAAAVFYSNQMNAEMSAMRAHINDRKIDRSAVTKLVATSQSVFGESGAISAYTGYAFYNLSDRRTLPEAEWAYTKALESDKRRGWKNYYDTVYMLGKLAEAQSEMRKFNSATQNFLAALKAIQESKSGDRDNVLRGLKISCLNGLARVYYQQSEYEKAALYEQQVVNANNSIGKSFGADIGPIEHLADLYIKLHQYREAEPLARQAVDYYSSQALSPVGNVDTSPQGDLAASYRRLATVLRGNNNAAEAERFESRADAIQGRRE
jgi:tetratricopeptide (TPR) repeat protein